MLCEIFVKRNFLEGGLVKECTNRVASSARHVARFNSINTCWFLLLYIEEQNVYRNRIILDNLSSCQVWQADKLKIWFLNINRYKNWKWTLIEKCLYTSHGYLNPEVFRYPWYERKKASVRASMWDKMTKWMQNNGGHFKHFFSVLFSSLRGFLFKGKNFFSP